MTRGAEPSPSLAHFRGSFFSPIFSIFILIFYLLPSRIAFLAVNNPRSPNRCVSSLPDVSFQLKTQTVSFTFSHGNDTSGASGDLVHHIFGL